MKSKPYIALRHRDLVISMQQENFTKALKAHRKPRCHGLKSKVRVEVCDDLPATDQLTRPRPSQTPQRADLELLKSTFSLTKKRKIHVI